MLARQGEARHRPGGRRRPRAARARSRRPSCTRIVGVEPRTALLERRVPEGRGTRPVAANVDQVFVVTAIQSIPPPFPSSSIACSSWPRPTRSPRRSSSTRSISIPARALIERCRRAGYAVYPTSTTTGEGMAEFAPRPGRTHLGGHRPVGRGQVEPAQPRAARPRSSGPARSAPRCGRGKNTTVSAVMLPLDAGGYLVDTPGLQRGGPLGNRPGRARHLLPRVPALPGRLPLRRLPPPDRARVPRARRRSRRARSRATGGRATWCCWRSWRARRRSGSERDGSDGDAAGDGRCAGERSAATASTADRLSRSLSPSRFPSTGPDPASPPSPSSGRTPPAGRSPRGWPCRSARTGCPPSPSPRSPSASSCFLVFWPKRWLTSRASSPTSSVSRARLVSGWK